MSEILGTNHFFLALFHSKSNLRVLILFPARVKGFKGVTVDFEPLESTEPVDKGLTSKKVNSVPEVNQGARVINLCLIWDLDYSTLFYCRFCKV